MAKQHNCYMRGLSYAVFMSFGQRIKTRRGDLRMTGDDLGRLIDPPVSKQTIAHWEADRYRPHIDQVAQLCRALGVSADNLVFGIGKALSPRAAEIAAIYDSLPPSEKARIEMMLNALGLVEPGSPSLEIGNSDRVLQHESKEQLHNQKKVQDGKKPLVFGPALTAAFSFGRDVKDGDSDKASGAPKKRRGSNS